MRALALLFLSAQLTWAGVHVAQQSVQYDPRRISGMVGYWDAHSVLNTLNGQGFSAMKDRSWKTGRLENLLVQSEAFSTTWATVKMNAFGATDTGGLGAGSFANTSRTTDPLGGNTADFLQEDGTSGDHEVHQFGLTTTSNPVFSVCVKAAGRIWVRLLLAGGSSVPNCYYNLDTGTVSTPTGGVGSIESLGNGWYRCILAVTGDTATQAYIRIVTSSGGGSYAGDNTSGLFLWGAQLRRSTSSATYVQTTTNVEDASHDLVQGTAANQPLISRSDNKGNWLVQSEAINVSTVWGYSRLNAFGALDTGAAGAGSFANTARTLDPLGGNTADFIQEDTTAANTHAARQTVAAISPAAFVFSVSIKPAGRPWAYLLCLDAAVGSRQSYIYFDPTNGAVGSTNQSGSNPAVMSAATITAQANGFYRCQATVTIPTQESWVFYIGAATADGGRIYNGDNTSGLFLWGASLRQSTWDSDYIATTATPALPGVNGFRTAYFDGSDDYLKAAAFTLNQPTSVYLIRKPVTWTLNDAILDGNTSGSGKFYQSATTPNVRLNAGSDGTEFVGDSLGNWRVSSVVFDGNSSRIATNAGPFSVSAAGANNMGGFTLGANGANAANWNGQVARVLVFNRTNTLDEIAYIQRGEARYGGIKLW